MDTITSKLEDQHKEWLEQIRAWERELGDMESINGKIVEKAASRDSEKKVEHFQNQILIQKQRLDEMKHNIKVYGGDLEKGKNDLEEYRNYYDSFRSEFEGFSNNFG